MATANNRIVDETYPHYLALHYEPGFRARRFRDRLRPLTPASGADMATIQADRVSIPAQAFVGMLGPVEVVDTLSAQARSLLTMGRHHGTGQCGRDDLCRVPG